MTATIRGLLVQSNKKLGGSVFHFDLPAKVTCPGKSELCASHCYATSGRFVFPQVIERLKWAYEQSKRDDLADRFTEELYRKGVLVCRFHVSGDIYSPGYGRKLLQVVRDSPHTTFYTYSRSWRVPAIAEVLAELAAEPNFHLWLSADDETGKPPEIHASARIAWMQTDQPPADADLIFTTREVRKTPARLNLDLLCPTETKEGMAKGTTCSSCQFCFREAEA